MDFIVAGSLGNSKGARAFAGKMVIADSALEAIQHAMHDEGVWFTATEVRNQKMVGAELQVPPREAPWEPKERDVKLTDAQIDLLLAITGPRTADPDAKRLGDWAVDLEERLRVARDT